MMTGDESVTLFGKRLPRPTTLGVVQWMQPGPERFLLFGDTELVVSGKN
jgi:hypothetical protein